MKLNPFFSNMKLPEDKIALCIGGGLSLLTICGIIRSRKKSVKRISSKDGRVCSILITGGASGIGLQTAVKFLQDGWIVGIYDLNIDGVLDKITAIDPQLSQPCIDRLTFKELDVTNEESCKAAIADFLIVSSGKIDALFNSAGLLYTGPFEKGSLAKQRQLIRVNCEGLMQMSYLSLDALKNTPNSCIVSMASISATGSIPNFAVYSSTKAFVWSFTGALSSELTVPYGIRVCDVSVSFVDTPMVRTQKSNNFSSFYKAELKKITPEEVANTVVKAVHTSTLRNNHFFVRSKDKFTLRLFKILEATIPSLLSFSLEKISLLSYQKARLAVETHSYADILTKGEKQQGNNGAEQDTVSSEKDNKPLNPQSVKDTENSKA